MIVQEMVIQSRIKKEKELVFVGSAFLGSMFIDLVLRNLKLLSFIQLAWVIILNTMNSFIVFGLYHLLVLVSKGF
jgi:hypothetical protein